MSGARIRLFFLSIVHACTLAAASARWTYTLIPNLTLCWTHQQGSQRIGSVRSDQHCGEPDIRSHHWRCRHRSQHHWSWPRCWCERSCRTESGAEWVAHERESRCFFDGCYDQWPCNDVRASLFLTFDLWCQFHVILFKVQFVALHHLILSIVTSSNVFQIIIQFVVSISALFLIFSICVSGVIHTHESYRCSTAWAWLESLSYLSYYSLKISGRWATRAVGRRCTIV